MEVLEKYGTPEQQEKWLKPLLAGEKSAPPFCMTEPGVAFLRRHQYGSHRHSLKATKWC